MAAPAPMSVVNATVNGNATVNVNNAAPAAESKEDDGDPPADRLARKRVRPASPTPSAASSEATAPVDPVGCLPCANQNEGAEVDPTSHLPLAPSNASQASRKVHYRREGYDGAWHVQINRGRPIWARVRVRAAASGAVFRCGVEGCNKQLGSLTWLARHRADVHPMTTDEIYACRFEGCTRTFVAPGRRNAHESQIHLKEKRFGCRVEGCNEIFVYRTTRDAHERKHRGYKSHKCTVTGCEKLFADASTLRRHMDSHSQTQVQCSICNARVRPLSLLQHMKLQHREDTPVLNCALCDYTTKRKQCLSQHMMLSHDVGLVWNACDAAPGECDFQAKTIYRLYDHIKRRHARVYAQRKKEQEERVRRALLDAGWQEWRRAETMPPVGFFRREKRIDFKCAKLESRDTWCSIDFVLGVPNGFVFLEVDENQHKYGYGDHLSCDMKRMANVMESLAVETNYNLPCLYWLRYNPNAWRVGGALRTVPKVEREARLVAWLERFACDKDAPFGIGYAFYDCEAEDEDGDPGMLDVLGNEEYNKEYAKAVDNLMGLDVGGTGDAERVCKDKRGSFVKCLQEQRSVCF